LQTRGLAYGHPSSIVTSTAMPPVNSSFIRLLLEQEAGAVSAVHVDDLDKLAETPCNAVLVASMTGVRHYKMACAHQHRARHKLVQEKLQETFPLCL